MRRAATVRGAVRRKGGGDGTSRAGAGRPSNHPRLLLRAVAVSVTAVLLQLGRSSSLSSSSLSSLIAPPERGVFADARNSPSGSFGDGVATTAAGGRITDAASVVEANARREVLRFLDRIHSLEGTYGRALVSVDDAEDAYPALRSGTGGEEGDGGCPFDFVSWERGRRKRRRGRRDGTIGGGGNGCPTPVVTVHDVVTSPPRTDSSRSLPEVLLLAGTDFADFVGGPRGGGGTADFLYGPSSVLATLELILECAACESLSPWVEVSTAGEEGNEDEREDLFGEFFGGGAGAKSGASPSALSEKSGGGTVSETEERDGEDASNGAWSPGSGRAAEIRAQARTCREDLRRRGTGDDDRRWMARLVATRRIVAVPVADPGGLYRRLVATANDEDLSSPNPGGKGRNGGVHPTPPDLRCDFPAPPRQPPFARGGGGGAGTPPPPPPECMRTFPAQLVNELFRSHAFQLGVSFLGEGPGGGGGGDRRDGGVVGGSGFVVGVPRWGAAANSDSGGGHGSAPPSPDAIAMGEIASAYETFALERNGGGGEDPPWGSQGDDPFDDGCGVADGGASSLQRFAFSARAPAGEGASDPLRRGGGGSLLLEPCRCAGGEGDGAASPSSCGYPLERTGRYDGSSLRAFVAAVAPPHGETRDRGDRLPGFEEGDGDGGDGTRVVLPASPLRDPGVLGRNVRASLLAVELVEPWTSVRSVLGTVLRDDGAVPLSPRGPGSCHRGRAMSVPRSDRLGAVEVTWTVGGALTIDETSVMYGRWGMLDEKIFNCVTQPTKAELDVFFGVLRDFEAMEGETGEEMDVRFAPVQAGRTRWRPGPGDGGGDADVRRRADGAGDEAVVVPAETTFSATLDLSRYKVGDVVAIYSLARVDQEWLRNDPGGGQLNVVNARTDPGWFRVDREDEPGVGGAIVRGRVDWWSVPVTITIGPAPGFSLKSGWGQNPLETSVRPADEPFLRLEGESESRVVLYSLFMAVLFIGAVFFCIFCREESDGTDCFSVWRERRKIKSERISMDDFFTEESDDQIELT